MWSSVESAGEPTHVGAARVRPKLLLVESDQDLSTVLSDLLELEGFTVQRAALCQNAAEDGAFDAIVFDPPAPDARDARDTAEHDARRLYAGSRRCIVLRRPFDADALLREIQEALSHPA